MNTAAIQIFKNNLTWKILAYFLAHPSVEVYVKELARRLKVGPTNANNALRTLEEMALLQRQGKARAHFYSLNNDSVIVKHLKIAYFLARLEHAKLIDRFLEVDEDLISLCIYGSFADGRFDEKSDLDLIIISHKEKLAFNSALSELERALNLEINIEVFSLLKWKRVKEQDKGFYQEVMASHVLLYGSQI
ncbi:MAG: nucleotidyltransferase domain-containing protein [Candidatus Omnitrophica bacterium]|nr:nucleotidyltransferase domain-containing protein [Candidatus Omnitrophota bacterium]